ncbi:hypothetical protein ACW9UR_03065 [Halovulum sp. GXIMD14794]
MTDLPATERAATPADSTGALATALITALAIFVLYQLLATMRAGEFTYPLDDVYIHLAIAENIAAGGYGVNPGEITSAGSSLLYPFLLTPFAGTGLQVYVPLFWNALFVIAGAALWGLVVGEARLDRSMSRLMAVLGVIGLNISGAGFVGMENAGHLAATLAVLLGVVRFLDTGRIGWILIAGVVIGPLLRYEALAPSMVAVGLLAIHGRWRPALALAAGATVPLVLFAGFLVSNGLYPLPNSVIAKMGGGQVDELPIDNRLLLKLAIAMILVPGWALILLVVGGLVTAAACGMRRWALGGWLALSAAGICAAHLVLGTVDRIGRYEVYAIAFGMGAFLVVAGRPPARPGRYAVLAVAIGLGTLSAWYQYYLSGWGLWSPQAIRLQQGEMGRFAKEVWKAPVAVNDLGMVSWQNPSYVLDLWGLASSAALEKMREDPVQPGWGGELAERYGADMAMLYADRLDHVIPDDWIVMGELRLDRPWGYVAGPDVTFYATRPEAVEPLREALATFVPGLPSGAVWTPANE